MQPKFVIFVLISTFLIAGIYSSSLSVVHARIDTCTKVYHGQFTCLTESNGDAIVKICKITKEGTKCTNYWAGKITTKLPPGAQEALDAASSETLNTTKALNTDILKDNGILEGNNNTSNDNVKEPKDPKLPEDSGSLIHEGR